MYKHFMFEFQTPVTVPHIVTFMNFIITEIV